MYKSLSTSLTCLLGPNLLLELEPALNEVVTGQLLEPHKQQVPEGGGAGPHLILLVNVKIFSAEKIFLVYRKVR